MPFTKENSKSLFFAATGAALLAMYLLKPQSQVYPPKITLNRVFTTIQSPDELQAILGTPTGLRGNMYLAFVRLGGERSNTMAQSLWKAMANTDFHQKEEVSAVCIELDGGRNDQLINDYIVKTVPSIVRLHKGVITDDRTEELDAEKLKDWIIKTLEK